MKDKIFIVCTGGSLRGFPFHLLENEDTIVVNYAYKYVRNWNHLVAMDKSIYDTISDEVCYPNRDAIFHVFKHKRYDKEVINVSGANIRLYKWQKDQEMTKVSSGIFKAWNSGHMALMVALKLGYKDIRLLGMDSGGSGHFYDDGVIGERGTMRKVGNIVDKNIWIFDREYPDVRVLRYDSGNWKSFNKVNTIKEICH